MCRRVIQVYCYKAETLNADEDGLLKRVTTGKNRKGMAIALLFGGKCGGNTENVTIITAFCCWRAFYAEKNRCF